MVFIKIQQLWLHFWHRITHRDWRIVATVDSADEVPKHIARNGVVIVGTVEVPKWIAFDCPCGAGHRIMVNADASRTPTWSVQSTQPLTITPSFDVREDKNCHFFIRDASIQWA